MDAGGLPAVLAMPGGNEEEVDALARIVLARSPTLEERRGSRTSRALRVPRGPDLLATAAAVLGLDPDDTAMFPAGRPIALTDAGTPVQPLLR